jgi:N utilization substance protein B
MAQRARKNARQVAVMVLNKFTPQRRDAGRILHQYLEQTEQSRLATDLVFGVIRNQSCIDTVITKISGVPRQRISSKISNILRIAVYELLFCIETPEYAIINEVANQAANIAGKKQTAFVNAVLRNINRAIVRRSAPLSEADAQKTVPQSPEGGCEFKIELLPEALRQAQDVPRLVRPLRCYSGQACSPQGGNIILLSHLEAATRLVQSYAGL